MKSLALFPEPPRFDVEVEHGTDINPSCRRCKLSDGVKTPCMAPEGEPGGLLVVNDSPSREDDQRGRPLIGQAGGYLRRVLERSWTGPLALDSGVKCAPGGSRTVGDKELSACRTYLTQVIREVKPARIIALGTAATHSLLGRGISPQQTRRGYTWLSSIKDCAPVPVFAVLHPLIASRNRFLRLQFEDDIEWACTTPITAPAWDAPRAHLVTTAAHAREAIAALAPHEWSAWDVETAGVMFDPSFRVLSVAVCGRNAEDVYVWTAEGLANDGARRELLTWLRNEHAAKIGQNEKYDRSAILAAYGVLPRGGVGDTRLWRKLLEPEANGALGAMADLIGYGGHKGEAEAAISDAMARLRAVLAQEKRDAKTKNLSFSFIAPVAIAPDPALESVIRADPSDSGKYVYALIPKSTLYRYNARDAFVTAKLGVKLEADLATEPDLRRTWDVLVGPAAEAVAQVEAWGVPTSRDALEAFDAHLTTQIAEIAQRLALYGTSINWDSPMQVGELLYKTLGLPVLDKTATGQASTSEATLDQLRKHHPLPGLILDHRGMVKMRGSFAAGMMPHIRSDGRIHPNLKLDGARSGRLSCVRKGTLVEIARDISKHPRGVPIEDVRVGDFAYCYLDDGKLALRKVTRAWRTGVRELVRVHWRGSGNRHRGYVDLTPDHLVKMVSGEWRAAGDLATGDRVFALSRSVGVGGYARVYPTGAPEIAREHRFVFEQAYGWAPEHVHHEDENKLNNAVSNLVGHTAAEHLSLHGRSPSTELRKFRAEKLRAQNARGMNQPSGTAHPHWLGLSRDRVEDALRTQQWSITKAARTNGWDFCTFKRYVIGAGFDLAELKRRNRALRRDAIVAGAAHARAGKFVAGNHEVTRVERLRDTDDVYDLSVDEAACFIAGELCVHNCEAPNLQQIPRGDSVEGKMARDVFRASPGHTLMQFDYSQIELRIAAALSRDPDMLAIFAAGVDYHQRTAELISKTAWGLEPSQVTKKERTASKIVNFGLLYGMGDAALAAKIGVTVRDATRTREAILGHFKQLARWSENLLTEARKTGAIWTEWDGKRARRRPMWRIADADDQTRKTAENGCVNTPVQGGAADFCLASLTATVAWIRDNAVPARLVLPVHDALLLEVRNDAVDEVAWEVRRIMTSWPCACVLEVDVEAGPSWGSLTKLAM